MRYTFYQKAQFNNVTIHGKVTTVTSKKKALQLINEYNAILTNNYNLKKVLDFTHPFKDLLSNLKKWNDKATYQKEVKKLSKHHGINIEKVVYINKAYAVTVSK